MTNADKVLQFPKRGRATGSQVQVSVRDRIANSPEEAIGALLALYRLQTSDEQQMLGTVHQNDYGFNALDAGPMSSIARWYLEKGFVTPRQADFVKKVVAKYSRQLEEVGFTPVSLPPPPSSALTPATAKMTVDLDGDRFRIAFSFPKNDNRFGEILAKVKTLSNRRWDSTARAWFAEASFETLDNLINWGFELSPEVKVWAKQFVSPPASPADIDLDELLDNLDSRLFPYQREGVAWLDAHRGRGIVGDDMGLGKTCQALSYLRLHPEKRPAVIVCPASLKLNWAREVRMWIGEEEPVQILFGKKPNGTKLNPKGIIIVNYDILLGWVEKLTSLGVKSVVFDECHYIKNPTANRTKAGKALAKLVESTICMSGTPIKSRPVEFFTVLNMLSPKLFPSYLKFGREYSNATHNGFGWSFAGGRNTDKLYKILTDTIMIRRKKEDVLTQLPPKRRSMVPMEPINRAEYDRAASNIISWILDNEGKAKAEKAKRAEVLVAFSKLKQMAVSGIMDQSIEWIRNFLESGEKLVVFGIHKAALDRLQAEFRDCSVRLDGSTSPANRQLAVDRFQEDDSVRLFIGNVQAAGVGITLTAASNVVFVELPWTPGELVQAEDRVHRIGQDSQSVNIWYLLAQNTVIEEIAGVLDEKARVLSQVLDGKEVEEENVLTALLERIREAA